MTIESPCVACCKLNTEAICTGCYRHIDEIADWNRQTDQRKAEILSACHQRREQLQGQPLGEQPITQQLWLEAKARARLARGG